MKTLILPLAALALLFSTTRLTAQDARYFRVAGPVQATITTVSADGNLTWTNAPTNTTFTVQTAIGPLNASNWVDWAQVPATNATTTARVLAVNPPVGMVFIPAGSFTQGDNLDGIEESLPLHTNYVSGFYMDRYEVTKAKWDEVYTWATNHGYNFLSYAGAAKASNHPMHTITFYSRAKWCNARSEMEGFSPCYFTDGNQTNVYRTGNLTLTNACVKWSANGYRLPTEAEWEKAARGGASGKRFPWGDTISHSQANYYSSSGSFVYDISPTAGFHPTFHNVEPYTSPVGYFAPNAYGLYDMAGNVWEWCWDFYEPYTSAPQIDPRGPNAPPSGATSARVLRGGSWGGDALDAHCADRDFVPSGSVSYNVGHRCVRRL